MSKAHLDPVIPGHLLEIRAEDNPDKEIYIFEKGEHGEDILTYAGLYEKSNRFAAYLKSLGLGKGDTYGLFMRNHPELVYALLGGTYIGAIAVPIDPRSRGDKLAHFLNDSRAKLAVTTGDLLPLLEEIRPQLPELKHIAVTWRPEIGVAPSGNYPALNEILEKPAPTVTNEIFDVKHPMEIIYTSGTTGTPKGVVIKMNRNGAILIMTRMVWKYKPNDVLYTGLSLTHGNAQAVTMFPAVALGIKAVISPRFTKSRTWDICRKYGCTTFSLLGGMMAGIYNEPRKENDGDNPVKLVISAGTPRAIWEDFEKRFNVKILEWYGAVEGGFAYKPIDQGPIGSFGKTLPGVMELKVADENDQELGPDQVGEMLVRMIKGKTEVNYLGRPEESEAKTRGGWLRTGDMVHKDDKGWFFFDYRKGTALRRAGDFIQPDLVEKVIGEHPDVSEVCVYGIPAAAGAPGESDLVAAVTPFEDKTIDPASIFTACFKGLEANSVPTYLQVVEDIPKTISEKAMDRLLKEAFDPKAPNVHKSEDYRK
ncbi:MAG: AMP-binding protein [Syntrophales bacterium]